MITKAAEHSAAFLFSFILIGFSSHRLSNAHREISSACLTLNWRTLLILDSVWKEWKIMSRFLKIISTVVILVFLPLSSRLVYLLLRSSSRDLPQIPIYDGAGGPILIVSSAANPFGRYQVELLRAQGYTCFKAMDITEVEANPSVSE